MRVPGIAKLGTSFSDSVLLTAHDEGWFIGLSTLTSPPIFQHLLIQEIFQIRKPKRLHPVHNLLLLPGLIILSGPPGLSLSLQDLLSPHSLHIGAVSGVLRLVVLTQFETKRLRRFRIWFHDIDLIIIFVFMSTRVICHRIGSLPHLGRVLGAGSHLCFFLYFILSLFHFVTQF